MSRLLLYHDFTSPFCRLAVQAVSAAAVPLGLELRPVPFELYPAPAPVPGADEVGREELAAAERVAVDLGLDLGRLERVVRTRKAHEALAHAREEAGDARPLLHRLYDALWFRGRDISRLDVLTEEGEAVGLEPQTLHLALGLDRFEAEVLAEQRAAEIAAITGVPAVQLGNQVATGLLPPDELVAWIEANR